jgi:hypothetical protein
MSVVFKFSEYMASKPDSHLIDRVTNFAIFMREILDMPVLIVGWQSSYKNDILDKDKTLRESVPRCVLTLNSTETNRDDVTSLQASTTHDAFNDKGVLKELGAPYVTLPFDVSFQMTIVCDNIDRAIRLSEYLSVLSIISPTCPGDDFTESIVEFATQSSVKNDLEKQKFELSNDVKLHVRLVEPVVNTMDANNTFLPLVSWVVENGGDPADVGYDAPTDPDDIQNVIDVFGNAIVHNVWSGDDYETDNDEQNRLIGRRYYHLNRPPAPTDEEETPDTPDTPDTP